MHLQRFQLYRLKVPLRKSLLKQRRHGAEQTGRLLQRAWRIGYALSQAVYSERLHRIILVSPVEARYRSKPYAGKRNKRALVMFCIASQRLYRNSIS